MKADQENKLDFDAPVEAEDEVTFKFTQCVEWTKDEKFYFFTYLINYGLPVNQVDGKTNYNVLKDK
jgi:hypothetical protein